MGPEFQAVILSGVDEAVELFPISNGNPAPLLPIANLPILEYQLLFFRNAKFSSVFVVVPREISQEIQVYLEAFQKKYENDTHKIEVFLRVCEDEHVSSTIEMLRILKEDIVGDVLVVRGDLITDLSLHDVADMHRVTDSCLTNVLRELPRGKTLDDTKKLQKRYTKKGILKYVGLVPPSERARGTARFHNRLLFSKVLAATDIFKISKSLLKREHKLVVRTDILDPHFYIFKKWVFDFMLSKAKMTSIQNDFIPYFSRLQYRDLDMYLPETTKEQLGLIDTDSNSIRKDYSSSSSDEIIKCMSYLLPQDNYLCERVDTIQNLLLVNKQVLNSPVTPSTPWPKANKKPLKDKDITTKNSIISADATIEPGCILKDCIIGKNATIAAGSKLNSCVVMEGVNIGSDCVLQGTIIGRAAVIQSKCNLNDCQIENNTIVKEKRVAKFEAILNETEDIVSF